MGATSSLGIEGMFPICPGLQQFKVTRKMAFDADDTLLGLDTAAESLPSRAELSSALSKPGEGDHKQETYSNSCILMFLIKDIILNQGKRPRARALKLYLLLPSPSSLPRK